jgi:hypothetical protein
MSEKGTAEKPEQKRRRAASRRSRHAGWPNALGRSRRCGGLIAKSVVPQLRHGTAASFWALGTTGRCRSFSRNWSRSLRSGSITPVRIPQG